MSEEKLRREKSVLHSGGNGKPPSDEKGFFSGDVSKNQEKGREWEGRARGARGVRGSAAGTCAPARSQFNPTTMCPRSLLSARLDCGDGWRRYRRKEYVAFADPVRPNVIPKVTARRRGRRELRGWRGPAN
ncbi:hypothetical protein EVAR_43137_1 [Eumeta japonica]|uniref:Uncharacterized protein n=1 Tax=Eumeta variegata TaxID=151549 RepID=A0A4C1XPF7_EUMVA|nr:hypothetical protein EVAR_43137_1 [Eumeta japonica]